MKETYKLYARVSVLSDKVDKCVANDFNIYRNSIIELLHECKKYLSEKIEQDIGKA